MYMQWLGEIGDKKINFLHNYVIYARVDVITPIFVTVTSDPKLCCMERVMNRVNNEYFHVDDVEMKLHSDQWSL